MAELVLEGDDLVVRLSAAERAETLHGDVRVPRAAVLQVEVVDDAVHAVRGLKLVGAGWPGRFAIGTWDDHGRRCFAVVHRGATTGVRVALRGARYDELVVACEDAPAVVARLGGARRPL